MIPISAPKNPGERMTWPRLSETLTGPKHPTICQSCGFSTHEITGGQQVPAVLERWRECDDHDQRQPDSPVVVLCNKCSGALIERHDRLYHALVKYEPWPGACLICVDCIYRVDTHCLQARAYGGSGLSLHADRSTVLVRAQRRDADGHRRTACKPEVLYFGEATGCTHREVGRT